MTPKTKDSRRADWKKLNFAGSFDWAVDLQEFTSTNFDAPPDRPKSGEGCPLNNLPSANIKSDVIAYDPLDADLNRLCKFACKYGYCLDDVCTTVAADSATPSDDDDEPAVIGEDPNYFNYTDVRWQNAHKCFLYKDTSNKNWSMNQCKAVCQAALDDAEEEGRASNYGCVCLFPLDEEIPWTRAPSGGELIDPGEYSCDIWLVNELAEFVLDAMPVIAQIGCYLLMSSLKLLLDLGAQFIPGAGKALDAGLDMATTAAQMASYIYSDEEDPESAIKEVFDILISVADGASKFKPPANIKKGSGKKGDDGNPRAPGGPRANTGGSGKGSGGNQPPKKPKCKISAENNDKTQTQDLVVTSLKFGQNARPTHLVKNCDTINSQACFHYNSVIENNKQWATLICPPEAATTAYRIEHTTYFLNKDDQAWIHAGKDQQGQRVRSFPWRENQQAGQMWKGFCFKNPLDAISDKDLHGHIKSGSKNPATQPKPQLEHAMVDITIDVRPELSISWGHSANPGP
ncbi:hypothetical protein B0J13DRAFT_591286 [Dactylonectria estremocensis]|uniref:Uncharacterized protein n=1 Tax=Dactylonectria estremocensis TaxID=1079267 RepID=A0A9P9I7D5_9HYPO|nr:hypothetical protein B0J13DRAFT_591286 [Dactylonectria estremocensis]